MIQTFATLLVFQTLGEAIAHALSLPIPGPVIGMVLLLCYLLLRKGAAQQLTPTANGLLRHMAILYVPAGVGVMVYANRIAAEWLPIAVALVVSTVAALVVTALVIQGLKRRRQA
ncbi:MAG: CidA/LrgA family protein [Proteobacteria bacterium]|nr:CidA/LrgA family protein [Pseudomonadota bacterium]